MVSRINRFLFQRIAFFSFIRTLFKPIKDRIQLASFSTKWRKKNGHNATDVKTIFTMDRVSVGYGIYGPLNIIEFQGEDVKLQIENFCSIAGNVFFF